LQGEADKGDGGDGQAEEEKVAEGFGRGKLAALWGQAALTEQLLIITQHLLFSIIKLLQYPGLKTTL